jgi:hypothetical protein
LPAGDIMPLIRPSIQYGTYRLEIVTIMLVQVLVMVVVLIAAPLYQFLDSIKHWRICDPGRQLLVMLDLAVDFDALFPAKACCAFDADGWRFLRERCVVTSVNPANKAR